MAQPEYTMQDRLVRDCEGYLTDSENGPEDGQYDHNEDYTFTICVDQANEIILAFEFFATEDRYDVMTIYDGPDVNSPVLATLSGIVQPPPVLIATSGCATIHFISDDNIVANGWRMHWMVEIDEPEIPDLLVDGSTDCPFQNGRFRFSLPIDCDLFNPANFSIVGPGNPVITGINLLDCDPNSNTGSTFEIVFSDSLRNQGTYRIEFNGQIQDVCGEWHDVDASVIFSLANCPIQVWAWVVDTGCVDGCGRVRAEIAGDAASNFIFSWSHTTATDQEVDICFNDTTTVNVTVVNINTSASRTASVVYYPYPQPRFLNPLQMDTFCASNRDHNYRVSIPGGAFYSAVIPDWERTSGKYQFWRWSNRPGVNQDIVEYVDPNGCIARDTFFILPINAGSIQAACAGTSPFQLNGGTPTGGYWEGPHTSPNGVFDPSTPGGFTVTYVAPNGCRRNKTVNVSDSIIMVDIDTLCSQKRIDLRTGTTPYGGRWSGPGITNNVLGRLEGWRPAPDSTYRYYYEVNGCRDSIDIHIKLLWSGPDKVLCVSDDTLNLDYTGNWSGPGTYLPGINAFDVSTLGVGEYTYTLEKDGCTDDFKLYIIEPYVEVNQALNFCLEDQWISLSNYITIFPDWGTVSGPGVVNSNDIWYFNPDLLGPGRHTIYFEAVGCMDSFYIDVEGPADIPPYTFCEFDSPSVLQANPSGGTWWGPGILDGATGLFDPQVPGIGFHEIYYRSPRGCVTIDTIEVFVFEEVEISGVDQQYCFSDTVINVIASPVGGELYINGILSSGSFNPSLLGTGNHEIYYSKGSGACQSDDRLFFSVLPPIAGVIEVSDDSICLGQSTVVSVATSGGIGNLSATWSGSLGFGNSHIVSPSSSNWYYVAVDDGCSVPFTDSVFVYVYPEFQVDLIEGPEVCYGDTTWVEVQTPNETDYEVVWQTQPVVTGFRYEGLSGFYPVRVTERFSGCFEEMTVALPGAAPLKANFSYTPNQPCIDIINNEIDIIDLAIGYSDGWMTFGDGSDTVSLLNGIISHEYGQIGNFKITQFVVNELGCTDTLSQWICVKNKVVHYFPNTFTPNNDGENDVYKIYIKGVKDLEWSIYNRWGELMFQGHSEDDEWDGNFRGQIIPPGVFVVKVSFRDAETGFPHLLTQSLTMIR